MLTRDRHQQAVLAAIQANPLAPLREVARTVRISYGRTVRFARALVAQGLIAPLHMRRRAAQEQAVLAVLEANPAAPLSEVAASLGISYNHAHTLLKDMASQGLVAPHRARRRTAQEQAILAHLQSNPAAPLSEVARTVGLSKRVVREVVKRLEAQGLIPSRPKRRSPEAISADQQEALALIQAQPTITLSALARALDVTQSQASQLVQKLVARGLTTPQRVRRAGCPKPRRRQYAGAISPDGTIYAPITHLPSFCAEHGLQVSCMRQVLNNNARSYRGWRSVSPYRLSRPSPRQQVFAFRDPHGTLVTGITNLKRFCEERGLNAACMRHVHAGRNKQHKGWQKAPEGAAQ
jgi:DNA-binding MarR family transcriptional regulator